MSISSDQSIGSHHLGIKFSDPGFPNDSSTFSEDSRRTSYSYSSQSLDDVEAEMKRLCLELKQTMYMYSTACKEALSARQQATELQKLRTEEERWLEEAKSSEEAAMSIVEKERAKAKAALEAKRRLTAEMKALKVSESFSRGFVWYRKYTVEEIEKATSNFAESQNVREGGYGPVFRGFLDHTSVAVKVLRPDAAQGRPQFQKEVEVLSCIRHPNMVLLLRACPEFADSMANLTRSRKKTEKMQFFIQRSGGVVDGVRTKCEKRTVEEVKENHRLSLELKQQPKVWRRNDKDDDVKL